MTKRTILLKSMMLAISLAAHAIFVGLLNSDNEEGKLAIGGKVAPGDSHETISVALFTEPASVQSKTSTLETTTPEKLPEHDKAPEAEAFVSASGQLNPDKPKELTPVEDRQALQSVSISKQAPPAVPSTETPPNHAKIEITATEAINKTTTSEAAPANTTEVSTQIQTTAAGDGKIANTSIGDNSSDQDGPWQAYKRRVFDAINSQRKYPKQAKLRGIQGTVVVTFVLAKNGSINTYTLSQPSDAPILNKSASKLFKKLRLPEPPQPVTARFPAQLSIPLEYAIR